MKILHLSDIHFTHITLNPLRLASKRLLGMTNLVLNRQFQYRETLLEHPLTHLPNIDSVWITGDLTTTALPEEFAQARTLFRQIEEQGKELLLIPGNHDRYTRQARQAHSYEQECSPFLHSRDHFPFLHNLSEEFALIGLDATHPISWLASGGRLLESEYQKLEELLALATQENKIKIVLCHYPVLYPEGFKDPLSHQLQERERLLELLEKYQVALYLHGHCHHQWILPPVLNRPLVINPGSATKKNLGGYMVYDLTPERIRVFPYLHVPQQGWVAQEAQEFPLPCLKERIEHCV